MNALARRREADEKTKADQDTEKQLAAATQNADVALKTSQTKLAEANAKKVERDANEPYKSQATATDSSP